MLVVVGSRVGVDTVQVQYPQSYVRRALLRWLLLTLLLSWMILHRILFWVVSTPRSPESVAIEEVLLLNFALVSGYLISLLGLFNVFATPSTSNSTVSVIPPMNISCVGLSCF